MPALSRPPVLNNISYTLFGIALELELEVGLGLGLGKALYDERYNYTRRTLWG